MAQPCGVVPRAMALGVTSVFPVGDGRHWNDSRNLPRVDRRAPVDDVAFMQVLVAKLVAEGGVDPERVFFAGISNGGFMSEELARTAALPIAGIAIVAAAASEPSRQSGPPRRPCRLLDVRGHSRSDPAVRGPSSKLGGIRPSQRGVRRVARLQAAGGGVAGQGGGGGATLRTSRAVEDVAHEWAQANGLPPAPLVEPLPMPAGTRR